MSDGRLLEGTEAIAAAHPPFAAIAARLGPCVLRPRSMSHFEALARAIVYQQLAGAAAAAIHGRVLALVPGRFTAEAVLALPVEQLRGAGLSASKTASLLDLATKATDGTVPLRGIARYGDDEVVERLVKVRGIGRWTAEMFLIFQLRRPDVWPVDDLGVRKGYAVLHDLASLPTPKELAALGEPYRPWRTVAAWYCWRAVDPPPR